jgi:hypothetical protein
MYIASMQAEMRNAWAKEDILGNLAQFWKRFPEHRPEDMTADGGEELLDALWGEMCEELGDPPPFERPKAEKKKPAGKSAVVLKNFSPPRPKDEVWYPCKTPASNYAVSSYANVAPLVPGHGVQVGKPLKPRVSAPKGGRALLCVQIRRDTDGKKGDYPVQWLFENNRPKSPAEVARRREYEKRRREVIPG